MLQHPKKLNKMRFLAVLGFLFVCAQADTDSIKDSLQYIPICVEELGLKLDVTVEIMKQQHISEDNEEVINFLACYYDKIGFMKDGKLVTDYFTTITPQWLKFRYGEEVDAEKISADILELCDDAFKDDSSVVAAIRFHNCAAPYLKGLNLNVVNDF